MIIAIDINDIIRDTSGQFLKTYQKFINPNFELDENGIYSFNQMEVYPFESEDALIKFKYIDYPYELYARASVMENMLPYIFNTWCDKTLKDLDEENIPHIILFSPFEMALSIQSTLAFLSSNVFRCREYYFPTNSMTIYDKADIVVTTQPSLIEQCPENKIVIKIETDYNKDIETQYSYKSLSSLINDPKKLIINILENKNNDR